MGMETTTDLTTAIAAKDTATLAECLLALKLTDAASRMVHAALIDELAARFPEVDAALDEWADNLEDTTTTMAEVTVAAIPLGAL